MLNSYHLFETSLSKIEIDAFLLTPLETIRATLAECGRIILQDHSYGLQIFRRNYEEIIQAMFASNKTATINSFGLHLLNVCSYALIQTAQLELAKQLLKKSLDYIESLSPDPILLSIALNNLAQLYFSQQKHFKALKYSLKAAQVMGTHLNQLKEQKDKQRISEDTVVLIAILILAKSVLTIIIQNGGRQPYEELLRDVNSIGYRKSKKHLGEASPFSKRFTPPQNEITLPFFRDEPEEANKQTVILKQLGSICDLLQNLKEQSEYPMTPRGRLQTSWNASNKLSLDPKASQNEDRILVTNAEKQSYPPPKNEKIEVVQAPEVRVPASDIMKAVSSSLKEGEAYKNKASKISVDSLHYAPVDPSFVLPPSQQKKSSILKRVVPPQASNLQQPKKQTNKSFSSFKSMKDGFQVLMEFTKPSVDQDHIDFYIECRRGSQTITHTILDKQFKNIYSQINFEDILPYDLLYENFQHQDILEHCILPFFHINNQEITLTSKCFGLLPPLTYHFSKSDKFQAFVFLHHIRQNQFRLSISPKFSAASFYVNMELNSETVLQHFQQTVTENLEMTSIYNSIVDTTAINKPKQYCEKIRSFTVALKYESNTTKFIISLLAQFQTFLMGLSQQTTFNALFELKNVYCKYLELSHDKGRFYLMRHLPAINAIDVYLENTYETYTPFGLKLARGSVIYNKNQLTVPISNKYCLYCQIILKKYRLVVYEAPLSDNQIDEYRENAIIQYPITENNFKRHFKIPDYGVAITIGVVTINNEYPIGVKVNRYSPLNCEQEGYFLFVRAYEWQKLKIKPKQKSIFKPIQVQFASRTYYFIDEWMEQIGFHKILQCFKIEQFKSVLLSSSLIKKIHI